MLVIRFQVIVKALTILCLARGSLHEHKRQYSGESWKSGEKKLEKKPFKNCLRIFKKENERFVRIVRGKHFRALSNAFLEAQYDLAML
jgi:hypothetical protein